jgi:hypothetical protein
VRVDSVKYNQFGDLEAILTRAPDARPGDHLVVVGDLGGFSLPVQFLVTCSGCFPPDLLRIKALRASGGRGDTGFCQGEEVGACFQGNFYQQDHPNVRISGSGVTVGDVTINDPSCGEGDSVSATVRVAEDAYTGAHDVILTTGGGESFPLQLTVYPPETFFGGGPLDVTFSDGTFANADWTDRNYLNGSFTSFQVGSAGSPAEFRETDQLFGTGESIFVSHTLSSAVYDPAVTGAIASIAFSVHVKFLGGSAGTSQVAHRLVLEQNGSLYYSNAYATVTSSGTGKTTA